MQHYHDNVSCHKPLLMTKLSAENITVTVNNMDCELDDAELQFHDFQSR